MKNVIVVTDSRSQEEDNLVGPIKPATKPVIMQDIGRMRIGEIIKKESVETIVKPQHVIIKN